MYLPIPPSWPVVCFNFFQYFIYLLLDRGERREKEREREKRHCVVASHVSPTGNLARNSGICHDWELNWRPFGSQASTQSTEPHQTGLDFV